MATVRALACMATMAFLAERTLASSSSGPRRRNGNAKDARMPMITTNSNVSSRVNPRAPAGNCVRLGLYRSTGRQDAMRDLRCRMIVNWVTRRHANLEGNSAAEKPTFCHRLIRRAVWLSGLFVAVTGLTRSSATRECHSADDRGALYDSRADPSCCGR